MKRVSVMLLFALALAACAALPPGDYALVPLNGQPVTPGAYRYDSPQGRYQVQVRSPDDATMAPTATTTPRTTPDTPEAL